MKGIYAQQISAISHEPGVRQQLWTGLSAAVVAWASWADLRSRSRGYKTRTSRRTRAGTRVRPRPCRRGRVRRGPRAVALCREHVKQKQLEHQWFASSSQYRAGRPELYPVRVPRFLVHRRPPVMQTG
jgi:hypothetical protein